MQVLLISGCVRGKTSLPSLIKRLKKNPLCGLTGSRCLSLLSYIKIPHVVALIFGYSVLFH